MKSVPGFLLFLLLNVFLSAETYHIGPGKSYQNIGDAPLASLKGGDSVVIYYRDEPYREKWVITAQGSKTSPVIFHGVAISGKMPVIDGQNAITPSGMNFWSEGRGVIKIGGSNTPPDNVPSYIMIENLEIKNGSLPFSFTGGKGVANWDKNAAAIYIEKGDNITIRNCVLHHCGNGFFSAHQSRNITIEYCYIYGNGNSGSIYEHNNYTESFSITFQFNRFGPLREGASGNNLKDRSAGCVIRYNWIESGNRQLDLVDSDSDEFTNSSSYRNTFVYGNILIEPEGAGNSQIIHYGGDSGEKNRYRKGTLYLYHNTIVSTRSGNTTLLRLSSPDESADVRNNIIFVSSSGSRLGIVDNDGTVQLRRNWIKNGWISSHSNASATVSVQDSSVEGDNPGFTDLATQDFTLTAGSKCIDKGILLADICLDDHKVTYEYLRHQNKTVRSKSQALDIGAIEHEVLSSKRNEVKQMLTIEYPNSGTTIYLKKSFSDHTGSYGIMLDGRSIWSKRSETKASNVVLNRYHTCGH